MRDTHWFVLVSTEIEGWGGFVLTKAKSVICADVVNRELLIIVSGHKLSSDINIFQRSSTGELKS